MMPLTLTFTEGVIPKVREATTMAQLSELFLKLHGLAGNKVLTPNVVGHIEVIAKDRSFSGLTPTPVVFIEWKVPAFAFTNREVQLAYVEQATEIVYQASGGKHPKDHIWVNVVHAVDGVWGINGKAMTNAELGDAISKG
jgi:hypothetical protein